MTTVWPDSYRQSSRYILQPCLTRLSTRYHIVLSARRPGQLHVVRGRACVLQTYHFTQARPLPTLLILHTAPQPRLLQVAHTNLAEVHWPHILEMSYALNTDVLQRLKEHVQVCFPQKLHQLLNIFVLFFPVHR